MVRRRERRRAARAFARAAALTVLGAPRLAPADPPIPRAEAILFEPGNPSHIVVRASAWGLFDSRDAGRTWSLYCSEVIGDSSRHETPPVVVAAGGRIIAAAGFQGMRASDDGCTWRSLGPFEPELVAAITPADASGRAFFAATARGVDGSVRARLHSSSDRGDTWKQVGDSLPADIAVQSVAVSPGDPKRLYVAGWRLDVGASALLSSSDAGVSWQVRSVPNENEYSFTRILAVHPSQPAALLLRVASSNWIGIPELPDQLWATADGGASWTRPYLPRGALPGFAIDSDASQVFIAGPDDGLLAAPLGEAFAGPFQLVSSSRVWGLGVSQRKLYAGHDDFVRDKTSENFTLGVSSDRGAHFASIMHLCDLGPLRCPAGSTVDTQCKPLVESRFIDLMPEDCTAAGGATSSHPVGEGGGGADSDGAGGGTGGAASGRSGTAGTPRETVDGSDGERVNGSDGDQLRARNRITKVGCGCSTAASTGFPLVPTSMLAVLAAAIAGLRSPRLRSRRFRPRRTRSSSSR